MIGSIQNELVKRKDYLEQKPIETIYFGGGTPSLLNEKELQSILDVIYKHYSVEDDPEITLEANPDDISIDTLQVWKKAGINRLSIGLQSFRQKDLDWMHRAHNVEEALSCVSLAQEAGFNNLTVDLIYGLPELNMEGWNAHIETVLNMNVPHISAYCLTVEPKTALKKWVDTGKLNPSNDEQQSEQFLHLVNQLQEAGFEQYEISNFCKPGFESKHNSNYWRGKWYLGVGPSAHSFNGKSRSWNVANNHQYLKSIEEGKIKQETEILSPKDLFNEQILTGLRTSSGVDLKILDPSIIKSSDFKQQIELFINNGWMLNRNGVCSLTLEGKLRSDYIASELFVV